MTFFYCDSAPVKRLIHPSLDEQEEENYRIQREKEKIRWDEKFIAACVAAGKRSGSETHRLWKSSLSGQTKVISSEQATPACP